MLACCDHQILLPTQQMFDLFLGLCSVSLKKLYEHIILQKCHGFLSVAQIQCLWFQFDAPPNLQNVSLLKNNPTDNVL